MQRDEPKRTALSGRKLGFLGLAVVAVAAGVATQGILTRKVVNAHLKDWTEANAVPVVALAQVDTTGKVATIELPGRLEAFAQAQLYARVSGYIKEWKIDMGTPVKAGQLLAEIDAPDLDQQIMQAEADVTSAQANAALSRANLERGEQLFKSNTVSKQDFDQRTADYGNKMGLVKSTQANLARLRALEKYKRVTAPFDGLVTARTTDVGALINAGASGAALFVVSDVSRLRVYVNVPQNYVPSIKMGIKAEIAVPEYPGRTFPATVEASSQAVDVGSGTTRMMLVVDNARGALMTGAYANVRFELPAPEKAINIPASALIFDETGLRVATLGPGEKVVLKQVTVARDLGKTVEIAAGLGVDDKVIASPPDGIATGDRVRLAGAPSPAATAQAAAPAK